MLSANKIEGLFRGIQTIRQLLPAEIEGNTVSDIQWTIATGSITDTPDYSYRGCMLDVARHYYPIEEVKVFIDWLAYYKINTFHMHLTDDQGWRLEIKSWPKLTEIGGITETYERPSGFYTQAEFKEIINYARDRYIEVIPEIDMPGHTNAALASYPELNCNNKATQIYHGIEVGFSSLCIRKELTYQFVDDVIREIAAISPSPYIHIGGDEPLSTSLEDYIYFISRVQDIVTSHNKKVVGWNEIAEIELNKDALVQFWDNKEKAKKEAVRAVEQGVKIIMSPADKVYLDMKYDTTTDLGKDWAAIIEMEDSYNWTLEDYFNSINKENIIGIECALWTEYLGNMDETAFMTFPRLISTAEIGWTKPANRDWEDFKIRLASHGNVLAAWGVNYYKSPQITWEYLN